MSSKEKVVLSVSYQGPGYAWFGLALDGETLNPQYDDVRWCIDDNHPSPVATVTRFRQKDGKRAIKRVTIRGRRMHLLLLLQALGQTGVFPPEKQPDTPPDTRSAAYN